jgi:hypothetical protein
VSDARRSRPRRAAGLGRDVSGDDLVPPERDPLGKMALYSGERPAASLGTFLVECSSCRRETPMSAGQLLKRTFPFSVHLPLVKRYSSYMRCPACGRLAWLRVTLNV